MDINKLKLEFPDVFAKAKAEGAAEEKLRASGWAAIGSVDPKAALEGIKGDQSLTPEATVKIMEKANAEVLAKLTEESEDEFATPKVTEEDKSDVKAESSDGIKAIMEGSKYFQ